MTERNIIGTEGTDMDKWDDEALANEMAGLIYERSQMTQGDADDLAWDLMNLVKAKLT